MFSVHCSPSSNSFKGQPCLIFYCRSLDYYYYRHTIELGSSAQAYAHNISSARRRPHQSNRYKIFIYVFVFIYFPFFSHSIFVFVGQVGQREKPTAPLGEFKCPEGYGSGNFADPVTCRRFYQVSSILSLFSFIRLSFSTVLFTIFLIRSVFYDAQHLLKDIDLAVVTISFEHVLISLFHRVLPRSFNCCSANARNSFHIAPKKRRN